METITYQFDLTADDYRFMSLYSFGGVRGYARALFPGVLVAAVIAFLFFNGVLRQSTVTAALTATLVYGLVQVGWWHFRFRAELATYYEREPYKKLLGAHELTFGEHGIRSIGPYHDSFRAWPAVTHACITSTHVLVHTIYGNVYLVPRSAVQDIDVLRNTLQARVPTHDA